MDYHPKQRELYWQQYWEENGIFTFNPKSKKKIFSIDTPPPTVSGKMHMGHASSYSQSDFIARYKRMRGFELFYPFGTDDNGLATEKLIEKTKGVTSKKMKRDDFVKLCNDTLKHIRPDFVNDWKKIGCSCDFDLFYSTIDEHSRKISQRSFLELYKMDRIYQKKAPIIFCPSCKTAIAQVEMEDMQRNSALCYVKGKFDSGEYILYATVRPELHPACVGMSVNKDATYVTAQNDKEKWVMSKDAFDKLGKEFSLKIISTYPGKTLVGKQVNIELAQKKITISHDDSVQPEFGTGIVYICSYGGLEDVQWMARHNTEPVHVMDESGTYNKLTPYDGLNSELARKQIIQDFDKKHIIIKKETRPQVVNVHERCQTPIEYIATKQWFVRYLDLKEKFLKAGAELSWYPSHMKQRLDNWIHGLQWDWCISRQRYFGVPFPLWYSKKTGEVILADESQLPIDPLTDKPKKLPKDHTINDIVPEADVLDTWATSSLTPQLAIELTPKSVQKKIFPMNLRPQAHDIITFWLFNTLVKSQFHYKKNPWKDVTISGFVLDPHGRKMSKSKGNVIAPQDMIAKYNADALRFWAASTSLGEDIPFKEKELVAGQKFVTKLWNASKFCFMHLNDFDSKKPELETIDKWLLSKLNTLIKTCTESFDKYEYSKTKQECEKFFWHVFCDNYIEISKPRLYNGKNKKSAQYTLYTALLSIVKLMAPITPHITEEVYHQFFAAREKLKSVHISSWPDFDKKMIDSKAEKVGDSAVLLIGAVRKFKSQNSMPLNSELKEIIISKDFGLKHVEDDLKAVLHVQKISVSSKADIDCGDFKVGIIK